MAVKTSPEGVHQRDDDEWNNRRRENRVRHKDGEIQHAKPARPFVTDDPGMEMEPDIARKEEAGKPECRQHAPVMGANASPANEEVAGNQQHPARGIQASIQLGQQQQKSLDRDGSQRLISRLSGNAPEAVHDRL